MDLTLDWQVEGAQATIRQGGVGAARLFGVPFLLVGGYLAYQFLGGVLHPGELTWAGWTLLPLMMAAFLVPGWILVVARKRARLDRERREVIEEFDYLVYTRRTITPVSGDSFVLLRFEKGATTSTKGPLTTRNTTNYTIHIYVASGKKLALIALFSEPQKADAVAFAAKAAAFLGITVHDRMIEGGDVTAGGVVVAQLEPEDAD